MPLPDAPVTRLFARQYDSFVPVQIDIAHGRISAITTIDTSTSFQKHSREHQPPFPLSSTNSGEWPIVAPAFFDLQINGYGGVWFSDESITVKQVLNVLQQHFQFGITRLCPTIITNSFEAMRDGLTAVRKACEAEAWAARMVPG